MNLPTPPIAIFDALEEALNRWGGTSDETLALDDNLIRLLSACLIGWLIGQVYRRTYTGRRFTPTLPDTNMLLCLGGALIWTVVGNNLVRAFGLAGTIGLIRYRTVVRDPKDTTILLFSMVLGMACGLGQFASAFVGAGVVILVMVFLHYTHRKLQSEQDRKARDMLTLLAEEPPPRDKKPPA